jgi:hypothetical protein
VRVSIYLIVITAWAGVGFVQGQPVNDHFTNRIVLMGSSLTFTANLAGATREPDESFGPCYGFPGSRSVWYELRTEEAVPVFLQSLRGTSNEIVSTLTVYASTNPAPTWLTARPIFDCMVLKSAVERPFLGFEAQPGFAYYFQLLSSVQGTFELQLDVSRSPVILEHPRDVTVDPAGAALFKASVISITPTHYQWLKEGIAIQGETSPMLMITNATVAEAAAYSVIVSNDTGSATSRVAQLRVEAAMIRPLLRIASGHLPNTCLLGFAGDLGRAYRMESSADLSTWAPEPILKSTPLGSVVLQTNAEVSLSASATPARKFFRVATYAPANGVCDANLKQIRHAKELWARDARRSNPGDAPTLGDLRPYYKDAVEPRCPGGGYYAMNPLDTRPTCSIAIHQLEEPR